MIYLCFRQRKQRDFIRKFEKLRNQGQTIVYRFFDVRCRTSLPQPPSNPPILWREPMEKNKKQNKKVQFVVVREFSGDKTMREAFEQLIERQTCEHFEEWLEHREMAQKAA